MPTYYVAELHEGLFSDPQTLKAPPRTGWRFFAPCSGDSIATCALFCRDLKAFDKPSRKAFKSLMDFLLEAGKAGKPWAQIFQDGKLFHPVHKFVLKRRDRKTGKAYTQEIEVHQFKKKKTAVRVLFVYGDGRMLVFITHTFEKETRGTPHAEQTRAAKEAQLFFTALDSDQVQIISDHGGKDETTRTFYEK